MSISPHPSFSFFLKCFPQQTFPVHHLSSHYFYLAPVLPTSLYLLQYPRSFLPCSFLLPLFYNNISGTHFSLSLSSRRLVHHQCVEQMKNNYHLSDEAFVSEGKLKVSVPVNKNHTFVRSFVFKSLSFIPWWTSEEKESCLAVFYISIYEVLQETWCRCRS